jgi:hypothetical protein
MDCVRYSLANLKRVIPMDILRAVFLKREMGYRDNMENTIDEQLMALVIRPRVLVDCNLVGGVEVFIPLDGIPVWRQNDYTSIYRIPKEKTQGRSIMSVMNITFSDPTKVSSYGVAAGDQNTFMLQAAQSVMDAQGSIPVTSTAYVQLIGENVVMVRDTVVLPANIYLRCQLANDENMSHIQTRSFRHFSKLVELAVKSYIYIEYAIPMDMGQLFGGQQLGRFKEFVDSYADSEELYNTYLTEKWTKVALMNDRESWTRLLRLNMGGQR